MYTVSTSYKRKTSIWQIDLHTMHVVQYSVDASYRRNGKHVGCCSLFVVFLNCITCFICVYRDITTRTRTTKHKLTHWTQNHKTQNSTVCTIAMQIIYQIPTFPWFHFKPFVLLSSLDTNRYRWRGVGWALKAIS